MVRQPEPRRLPNRGGFQKNEIPCPFWLVDSRGGESLRLTTVPTYHGTLTSLYQRVPAGRGRFPGRVRDNRRPLASCFAKIGKAKRSFAIKVEVAMARVGGVRHASHTPRTRAARLHVVAEAILRIDRVAEITGNGPRAPKLLAGDAFAARCARSQVTLAVASSREIVHTGRIRCS